MKLSLFLRLYLLWCLPVALVALAPSASAQTEVPLRIGLGGVQCVGLDELSESKLRNMLHQVLQDQHAVLVQNLEGVDLGEQCLQRSTCVEAACRPAQLDAVVFVDAIRMGPVVKVQMRMFAADSGQRLLQSEWSMGRDEVCEQIRYRTEIQSGLASLREQRSRKQTELASNAVTATQIVDTKAVVLESMADANAVTATQPTLDAATEKQPFVNILPQVVTGVGATALVAGLGLGVGWWMLKNDLNALDEKDGVTDGTVTSTRASEFDAIHGPYAVLGVVTPVLLFVGVALAGGGIAGAMLLNPEDAS